MLDLYGSNGNAKRVLDVDIGATQVLDYVVGMYSTSHLSNNPIESAKTLILNFAKKSSKYLILDIITAHGNANHITGYMYPGGEYGQILFTNSVYRIFYTRSACQWNEKHLI